MTDVGSRRALRIAVYAFLVASAAAVFFLGDQLWTAARQGDVPIWMPLVAPSIFTLFVVVYAFDRWLLVRRRASSLGRAVLQVVFAIIFLSLLWPQQASQYRETMRARQAEDYAVMLLRHRQAEVRAAACELLGLRAQISQGPQIQKLAEADDSPRVRAVCHQALERLTAESAESPKSNDSNNSKP